MRRAQWKKKNVSAGRSAQAQTSCRRRGRLAIPRGGQRRNARPLGNPSARGSLGYIRCADFRCRWPVVDESLRSGPMRHRPLQPPGARSEAERAEREAGQMRSCTPTTSAPSATGRQSGKSQKSIACPKARPNRSRHWYADPPYAREGHCTGARPALFLLHRARRVLFWRNQKENGAHCPAGTPAESPGG